MAIEKTPFGEVECVLFTNSHLFGGEQCSFLFENDRGASVIRDDLSYGGKEGLWELAVLKAGGFLDYSTEITDDVIGYLTEDDVFQLLARIRGLK